MFVFPFLLLFFFFSRTAYPLERIGTESSLEGSGWKKEVACFSPALPEEICKPSKCSRQLVDGLFSEVEINNLVSIVERALSLRDSASIGKGGGGPSIFDMNTGFIRDSHGLDNIFFSKHETLFSAHDFATYGNVIRKLKSHVQSRLGAHSLYFTAPTFVTRLDGRNTSWSPTGIHDEYWHLHVDQNSTSHYFYSGLLYLSTYKKDFDGGLLKFYARDEVTVEQVVEPRRGRALFFTSGPENPHSVDRVESGIRYVLSFWFTCDPQREFQIFLDGQAHLNFGKKFLSSKVQKSQKAEL